MSLNSNSLFNPASNNKLYTGLSALSLLDSNYTFNTNIYYENNIIGWAPELVKRRPEITMEMAAEFLNNMYTNRADFVFTVDRDFVRNCQTPILVLPDDIPAHPYR